MRLRADNVPAYLRLMRVDRPIGTLLLLWPTLLALWLAAGGVPDAKLLIIFTLGTFLMRSAGCVINDFADRRVDGLVQRTEARPLVVGAASAEEAVSLFILLGLASFVLVLFTNTLTILLSVVGALLAAVYPFMKRYTHLPQLALGAAFSWSIPMAFAAQSGALPPALWLLYLANLLWTVVYDTLYAMVDREDDLKAGIKSTAILFGDADKAMLALLQALTVLTLWLVGQRFALAAPYFLAVIAVAGQFVWHQRLIRERERAACFRAFLANNHVGLTLFVGVVLHFLLHTNGGGSA
jgi:4-hydroxybenzoate polyprenyltransferase